MNSAHASQDKIVTSGFAGGRQAWETPQLHRLDIGATAGGIHPPPYFTEIKGVLNCTKTNTTSALTHSCSGS